ncbi:hypothetical protein [Salinicoccus halodurans]|nr:hypothetical protein [Salinicoccus halodurans]
MEEQATFWNRFIFYTFYYVLFDSVPMKTINGMPNNGMIIYELIRYGRRIDHNRTPFLPSTSDIETEYQDEMKELQDRLQKERGKKKEEQRKKEKAKKKKENIKCEKTFPLLTVNSKGTFFSIIIFIRHVPDYGVKDTDSSRRLQQLTVL